VDDLIHADMECRDYVDEAKSYQLSLAGLTPLQRPYDRMVPRRSCSGDLHTTFIMSSLSHYLLG